MSDTGNLLGEAASLDPAIRDRVISLANLALDEAEFLIKFGDPVMKSKLIGSFMTTFAKHMRTQDTNNEMDELRKQLDLLTQAVHGRTPGQDTHLSVVEEDIEPNIVDMPPGFPPMLRRGVDNG